jgi:hypothetical protein
VTSFVSCGRTGPGTFVSAHPKPVRTKESRRYRKKIRITKRV